MVGQVGGENPARHHLLKGLRGVSADLNAHSFFILGLESDSKLQEERITLHTSLRAIKLVTMSKPFNKPTLEDPPEGHSPFSKW